MATDNLVFDTWPPAYVLKKHPRAKHVRFRASVRHGLELIVPLRFNLKTIPAILERNRTWIEKQLLVLKARFTKEAVSLPQEIEFAAFHQVWTMTYVSGTSRLKLISRPGQELVLFGKIQDEAACKKKLVVWIKAQAKELLLAALEEVSQELGLSYKSARIRDQLSRWGSCSAQKALSLNYKLLFLPKPLMRHILIHELCHTVHLNHSEKFWLLVAQHDQDSQKHRRALRKASSYLPLWLP